MEGSGTSIVPSDLEPNYAYKCYSCLTSSPTNPVATSCGHMFCWPCLFPLLQDQPQPCPVCRTALRTGTNIIPIYGSNEVAGSNSAVTIPPRPNPTSPVSAPFPFRNEVLKAFGVVTMVNDRMRNEVKRDLAAHGDRYRSLASILRELSTDEQMCPEERRREKNMVWRRMAAIHSAMEKMVARLEEMRRVHRQFKTMQNEVTQVGWWSFPGSMPSPDSESEEDEIVELISGLLSMQLIS